MARSHQTETETILDRIKRLIGHSQGTMPICMVVDTQEDVDQALDILSKNQKAAELISIKIKGTDQELLATSKRKARVSGSSPHRGRRR